MGMSADDDAKLIAEYQRLRRLLHELMAQAETVDSRLIEIERRLPDDYPNSPEEGDRPATE
jgi:hypothetical protein